jgi:cellulose synthase (UDP-forming)
MSAPSKGPVRFSFAGWLLVVIVSTIALAAATLVVIIPLGIREQLIFGVTVFLLALLLNLFRKSTLVTMMLVVISLTVSTRYIYWRLSSTLGLESVLEITLGSILLMAEVYAYVVMWFGYLQTMWPLRRNPVPLPRDPSSWPTVDVLVPTYNEPLEVVRATLLAAKAIDWPADRLHVACLDDGRRPEFKAFCESAGVGYVTRPDNEHAKAGNINHALKQMKGEFVAIFDCDHLPTRSFLQFTMGWMLRDPKMALVQTPHHFHSPDPFEKNFKIFRRIPNEEDLFYGLVQPGNDLWNATFFCGSCAVLRRTALDEVGGIATSTVTEDAHTALKMHRKGWNSSFINVPMASGLATESLSAHVGQRIRWARGMTQVLRTDNPLFGRGLKLMQRFFYSSAMIHFLNGLPRLIFMLAPLIFLFFSVNLFNRAAALVLTYALPHLFHAILTSSRIQRDYRHSFWAEVYETVLATYILLPTTLALINPKLGKFNVTAKGGLVKSDFFDAKIARPYIVLLLLNLAAIVVGAWRIHLGRTPVDALAINLAWATYNVIMLSAAIAVAYEAKQRRKVTRISVDVPITLRLASGHTIRANTVDLSRGGALIQTPRELGVRNADPVHVSFFVGDTEASVPATVRFSKGNRVHVEFGDLTLDQESAIVRTIYSRADAWVDWNDHTKIDRPLLSWFEIIYYGLISLPRIMLGRPRSDPS